MSRLVDYFYIASGLASLLAFFGFVTAGIWPATIQRQVVIYGVTFAVATLAFWVWFYFFPVNKVRERIWERTIATRYFSDPSIRVGVAEGEFTIHSFGPTTVILPPFGKPPSVTIHREKAGNPPRITLSTSDSFTVESDSTDQWGEWSFRARGELLTAKP